MIPPTAAIVAVNTTFTPAAAGFTLEDRFSVETSVICSMSTAEVEVAWFVSPEYTAVRLFAPTLKAEVVSVAIPPLTVDVPITAPPSSNVTLPEIPGLSALMVAVSVTGCPSGEGLLLLVSTVVVVDCCTTTVIAGETALALLASPL